ncbi:ribosomal RNA methyltransferase RrmJ/FtsJ [Anaeromyxobacter dehalogenans 2CP-1]|uniref:Ribosomal RNA large subunit methyltransferase E n=1 Tax=Anaeromyxobacter dehalogenans (strain ATCC BAA-258 / DSM 21875 / 2CP-1) TaxID=455488 RepID=B8JFS7_ANAD2|nr:RlmE family RNA methyltransferase [Anaeromyxobacter dehalogenans]ACL64515.1 ribosomal RNA methyltransferase RrmJ/FtsJ [Anaeromyxobacter dehalogenans 2CP-1]
MAKPYDPKDFYYRKAKKQGLRARSAFKIEEILHRHRLLGRGDAVLDLGAAPGGFLQILADAVGEKGVAVGVDLEPIRNLGKRWVRTAVVDLLAPDALDKIRLLHEGRFRLVTSDMAPKTIGIKVTDEARSLELVRMALSVAEQVLVPGGAFVAKVFMGGDFPALKRELQGRFAAMHVIRPEAVRESSYEVYVLGTGFRGGAAVGRVAPPAEEPGAPAGPERAAPEPPAAPEHAAPQPPAAPEHAAAPAKAAGPAETAPRKKPAAAKKATATKKPASKKPAARKPTARKPAPRKPARRA